MSIALKWVKKLAVKLSLPFYGRCHSLIVLLINIV